MADSMWAKIEATGFANGERFTDEEQVRDYFTVENMLFMFSGECDADQDALEGYADAVIHDKRHCDF